MKLDDRAWKPVLISDLFTLIRGRENNMATLDNGNTPLISAKRINNGLKGFVATPKRIIPGNCITLNNDGDGGAGLAYYQPADMALDTHVTALIPKKKMSMQTMLFISGCLSKLHGFFGHGLSISNPRAEKIRIMLPVTDKGEPDYQFMEDYVRDLMVLKRNQYHDFIITRMKSLGLDVTDGGGYGKTLKQCEIVRIASLQSCRWKPFPIAILFERLEAGKGKGLNHLEQTEHGVSYIGATNRNNGVLCHVKENDMSRKLLQKGNCIGFIKNGDGSAGYAIYKQEPFVSTSDVIYGYANWLNRYTGLFFVAAQDMISPKYSHGHKRNAQHLKGDSVMLPAADNGEPDFDFMENYSKRMMFDKYKQYLAYISSLPQT